MFSEYPQSKDRTHYRTLLVGVGIAVIVLQLAAMAMLASSQVAKAELRDVEINQQRIASAQCSENRSDPARLGCLPQMPRLNRSVLALNLPVSNPQETGAFAAPRTGTGLLDVSHGSR